MSTKTLISSYWKRSNALVSISYPVSRNPKNLDRKQVRNTLAQSDADLQKHRLSRWSHLAWSMIQTFL